MIAKTLTTIRLEEELSKSQHALYAGNSGTTLLETLKSQFPNTNDGYLLQWIPEQGEDIFWILIDPTTVVMIEIPRPSNDLTDSVQCKKMTMKDYVKRLSPHTKRKVELAVKLMTQGRNK